MQAHSRLDPSSVASEGDAAGPLAVALDIGSSSVRSMAFDRLGREVQPATAQLQYELETHREGQVTLDPEAVVSLAVRCLDQTCAALEGIRPVAAVGISCFWHSLIGLDARGDPATQVYHLADSRSAGIVDDLRGELDEPHWKQVTGTVFHSSYWPAKLRWLQQTNPAACARTALWTSAADYLMQRLTGTATTSLCMASGTGLCDISSGSWSAELAGTAGARLDQLPEIVDRDHAVALLPAFARRWPLLASAPWYPPLGDGACANVGCGATDPSRIALTLGTTGAMRVITEGPTGTLVRVPGGLWTYRLDRRRVIHGAAITNGGIWVDFVRALIADSDHTELEQAFRLPPASHGLTILPFLAGERSPIWNDRAQAVVAGLSPRNTRADLVRAALESVAHRLAIIYRLIAPVAASDHQLVANGAALLRSPGWQRIVAAAIDQPIVTLPALVEASARGAAIAALESAGVLSGIDGGEDFAASSPVVVSDPGEAEVYRKEQARQERLRMLLYPGSTSWDA
jgi:gluconokinase